MNWIKSLDLKDHRKRDGILLVLATVFCAILFYYQLILPLSRELNSLKQVYHQKSVELNAIRNMKTQRDRLSEENVRRQGQLDSLRRMFPDRKEIPRLIRDINSIAKASGIYTRKFNPLPDKVREHYIENRYFVSVSGGYHQLGNFFAHMANLPLIINLSNVKINTDRGIEQSIAEFEKHGKAIQSIVASFEMTTFSSRQ